MSHYNVSALNRDLVRHVQAMDIPGLRSACFVGSHLRAQVFAVLHDIDLVLVVERITPEVLASVADGFRRIAQSLEQPGVRYCVELRSGPLMPARAPKEGERLIQLHVQLYDPELIRAHKHYPGVAHWVAQHRIVVGRPLSDFWKHGPIPRVSVMRDFEFMASAIETRTLPIFFHTVLEGAVVRLRRNVDLNDFRLAWLVAKCPAFASEDAGLIGAAMQSYIGAFEQLLRKVARIKWRLGQAEAEAVVDALKLRGDVLQMLRSGIGRLRSST